MKILIISTYSFDGAGTAARRLHEALLKEGVSSDFLCLYDRDSDTSGLHVLQPGKPGIIKRAVNLGRKKIRSMLNGPANRKQSYEMFTTPHAGFHLHNHPLVREADVIHLHWIAGVVDYPSFFANVNTPIVWTLHDMNPFKGCFHYEDEEQAHVHKVAKLDESYKKIKRAAYRLSTLKCITAPSNWLTNTSSSSELLGSFPHRHIPNGVDTDIYVAHDRDLARDIIGVPRQGRVLLFVSTNVENRRKGFDLLIEALQSIPQRETISLVAVGKRPQDPLPGVHYLGQVRDERLMAVAYSAADAFVIPSREDNFPNVILESLACGTPVVGTPVGGMLDVIRNGENGFLAESLSADALRNAIVSAIEHADDFSRDRIRNEALEHFHLSVLAKNFIELYKSIS